MRCDFVETGRIRGRVAVRCRRCGLSLTTLYVPSKVFANCRAWPFWHEFGEWVSILLAAIGINPRRYGWLRWKLGLDEPGSCASCDARKLWLNTLGGRLATSTHWAAKWMAARLVRRH